MPEIKHVVFNHKDPAHQTHLEELQQERSHDRARYNLTKRWAGNEEHRATPLENFIAARIEDEKEAIRDDLEGKDEPTGTQFVLQYLDGKPVGFTKYRQGDRPFINFMFVKPDMRETLGYEEPLYDGNGAFLGMKPPSRKRAEPLLLAKKMIDFLTKVEGAAPGSSPTSEQGARIMEKYLGAD
ncbi:hypothetical protein ACFLQ2_05065 [archaeon]